MFSWFHFLSYAVVTAVTPGPNNLMSLSNAGRLGFRRAFPFNLGVWAGFSVVMVMCTVFCSALSELIPRIKTPMLFLGAAYMLWLAWKTWRSGPVAALYLFGNRCDCSVCRWGVYRQRKNESRIRTSILI